MIKEEYKEYENDVAQFFKDEGITNLSIGHITCPYCDFNFIEEDTDECTCGNSKQALDEPSFSWRACECCGSHLGGDRYHATGYNPTTDTICEYEICTDCVYYTEYDRLDDMTMMDMEKAEQQ